MESENFMEKALEIGNSKKFTVRFLDNNLNVKDVKELTYLQLGMYLVQNNNSILSVHIIEEE